MKSSAAVEDDVAVSTSNGQWQVTVRMPHDFFPHVFVEEIYIHGGISASVSAVRAVSLRIYTNTATLANPCVGGTIRTSSAHVEAGLALSATTEEEDGGSGNIQVQLHD